VRGVARLVACDASLPKAKPHLKAYADQVFPRHRCGDMAQGLMDFASQICTPKNPACALCPIQSFCKAKALQAVETYPRKPMKSAKPERRADAFLLCNPQKGTVFLERRPEKGLLAGMPGFPLSDWLEDFQEYGANIKGLGKVYPDTRCVVHVFTHFRLYVRPVILTSDFPNYVKPEVKLMEYSVQEVDVLGLPTLMRKIWQMVRKDVIVLIGKVA
jgi:A/G-specific adenine glycosylase